MRLSAARYCVLIVAIHLALLAVIVIKLRLAAESAPVARGAAFAAVGNCVTWCEHCGNAS